MQRRVFIATLGTAAAATAASARAYAGGVAGHDLAPLRATLAACEHDSGGRLGLLLHDTGDGTRLAWRGDERFPMCSTFKWLLAAAVLARCDAGKDSLARRVAVASADLLPNSPFSETRAGHDASVDELCEAAITRSDNAAANLLLPAVGGPAGLTRFLRGIGDARTRLDRTETALNSAIPGDPRDTSTPAAMAGDLQAIVLGSVLVPASRARLLAWLHANQTGGARLRAGLPAAWRVGDKTGSGANGTTNDVAILDQVRLDQVRIDRAGATGETRRAPVLLACFLTGSPLDGDGRDAILARIGAAVGSALA
jgi:beta-lactamase class A